MATPKKAKRALSDSDSESETTSKFNSTHFPRFLIIEAEDSTKPITKLSPFIIEKTLKSILGTPKSVKKLRTETLLVECSSHQQASNLLNNRVFFNINVRVYPHATLNTCKGVIRCKDLAYCDSDKEIKDNLKDQAVSDVKRISVFRNGTSTPTNTYILTFSSPDLPTSIKIGFQSVKVDVYVPNPLRCFRCQRYGHHEIRCKNSCLPKMCL